MAHKSIMEIQEREQEIRRRCRGRGRGRGNKVQSFQAGMPLKMRNLNAYYYYLL